MSTIKILIADDHEVVRTGLAAIFGFDKNFKVVGLAENGRDAVRLAQSLKPDVVIMDLMMPLMNGVDATREILARQPGTRVLILTTYAEATDLRHAIDAGAVGAISKDSPNKELVKAIKKIASGEHAFSSDIENQLAVAPEMPTLTCRQMDILHSLTRGLTNQDIAKQFGITEDGAKAHMKAIFAKLGVANRSEAASYALRHHLVKSDPIR